MYKLLLCSFTLKVYLTNITSLISVKQPGRMRSEEIGDFIDLCFLNLICIMKIILRSNARQQGH